MGIANRFEKVVNRSFIDGVILGGGAGKIIEQLVAIAVIFFSSRSGDISPYIVAAVMWVIVVVIGLWISAHWTEIEDVVD